jgi:hypothetical protein
MHDPQHPKHANMVEWIGGEVAPDVFVLDEVNTALQDNFADHRSCYLYPRRVHLLCC